MEHPESPVATRVAPSQEHKKIREVARSSVAVNRRESSLSAPVHLPGRSPWRRPCRL